MSYDLYIGDQNFNATWNIGKMFYDHMPPDEVSSRGGLATLHGLTGRQAADKVAEALVRIEKTRCELWRTSDVGEPQFCAKYDAPNGWGSAIGALTFLSMFMAACYQNPRRKSSTTIRGLASQQFTPSDRDYVAFCKARIEGMAAGVVVGIGRGRTIRQRPKIAGL